MCEPTESPAALNAATPAAFTFAVPTRFAPSKKLTAPNGAPTGEGEIAAVNRITWPTAAGFGVADKVVVVGTDETVSEVGGDVEVSKLELPE